MDPPSLLSIQASSFAKLLNAHTATSPAQVPDGDWFCAFNPDPVRRACTVPEQALEADADGDGQLAILRAPGYVPAGGAGAAADPDPENVKFFRQLLAQRAAGGNTARPASMRTVRWLAMDAAVPVSFGTQSVGHALPEPLSSAAQQGGHLQNSVW